MMTLVSPHACFSLRSRRRFLRGCDIALMVALAAGLMVGLGGRLSAAQAQQGQAPLSGAYVAQLEDRLATFEQELQRMTGAVENLAYQLRQLQQQQQNQQFAPQTGFAPQQPQTDGLATPLGANAGVTQAPPTAFASQQPFAQTQQAPGQPAPAPLTPGATQPLPQAGQPLPGQEIVGATQAQEQAGSLGTLIVQGDAQGNAAMGDPQMDFDTAYNLLASTEYDSAYEQFRSFIDTYPDNPLISDAYYWIGEIALTNGNTSAAIAAFASGYRDAPDSAKGAESLFKLGTTLLVVDRTDEACRTFQAFLSSYPDSPIAMRDRVINLSADSGCPA